MPKKILVVFHNGLNYVYYVIIKELPNKIEGKFNCLGENNENIKPVQFWITKMWKRIIKMEKNSKKAYLTNCYNIKLPKNIAI